MAVPLLILATLALGFCISLFVRRWTHKNKGAPSPSNAIATKSDNRDTCVSPTSASSARMEGCLRKKARTHAFSHTIGWQKRFFVANGSDLTYYKDEKRTSLPRKVEFIAVSSAANVITLTLPTGPMYLLAETDKEARAWVQHLTRKATVERGRPPPEVSGALPPTLEELNKAQAGVVEFRRLAQGDITEWCEKGSELALAVRESDRAIERFLWAREFDVSKALAMWRETMGWRDTRRLDFILDAPYPEAKKIKAVFPGRYHGFDKLGRLVYIEDTGSLNLEGLMAVTDVDGLMQYHLSTMEFMHKYCFPRCCIEGADPCIDQVTTILNLKGLHKGLLKPQVMKFLKMVMDIDQNYYPECLGKTFIVNAPSLFNMIWKIVRPWLAPRVMSKIEILGEIKEGSSALLELFDADQLPVYLGGTCQCEMSTDCPHAPGQLMRDYLRVTEIGRAEFDREKPGPTRKLGFGKV